MTTLNDNELWQSITFGDVRVGDIVIIDGARRLIVSVADETRDQVHVRIDGDGWVRDKRDGLVRITRGTWPPETRVVLKLADELRAMTLPNHAAAFAARALEALDDAAVELMRVQP